MNKKTAAVIDFAIRLVRKGHTIAEIEEEVEECFNLSRTAAKAKVLRAMEQMAQDRCRLIHLHQYQVW